MAPSMKRSPYEITLIVLLAICAAAYAAVQVYIWVRDWPF